MRGRRDRGAAAAVAWQASKGCMSEQSVGWSLTKQQQQEVPLAQVHMPVWMRVFLHLGNITWLSRFAA